MAINLPKCYGNLTTDDILAHQEIIEDEHLDEDKNHDLDRILNECFKEGRYRNLNELWNCIYNSLECYGTDPDEKILEKVFQEYVVRQKRMQSSWPVYTDCDHLFIVLNEATRIFPNCYFVFGRWDRPLDSMAQVEDEYPKVSFGKKKGDATIIYIEDEELTNRGIPRDELTLQIFNGYPEDRIKIRDFICDQMEKIKKTYYIERDAKTCGSVDQIRFHNFDWRYRYPKDFFDK